MQRRQRLAWKLYRDYVAIGAPHELNLDILSRRVTDLAILTPHYATFDASYKRIFNVLEMDAYARYDVALYTFNPLLRRFLQWEVYKNLSAEGRQEEDANQNQKNGNDSTSSQ